MKAENREKAFSPKQVYAEVECDGMLKGVLRGLITKWANAIPNHGLRDLGGELEPVKALSTPAYALGITTLYESRGLKRGQRPHPGGAVSQKTLEPADVDVWAMAAPAQAPFAPGSADHVVAHTDEIEDCGNCGATARVTCPECSGARFLTCRDCRGEKEHAPTSSPWAPASTSW